MSIETLLGIIRRERNSGCVRAGSSPNVTAASELASLHGLNGSEQTYLPLDRERARSVLVRLLHQDMAYNMEIVPIKRALEIAGELFSLLDPDVRFLSNSTWNDETLQDWNPATSATLDSGLLILGKQSGICIWFEDED